MTPPSPPPMTESETMSDWQKTIFQVMVDSNGKPAPRSCGGWVKGPFALDPRYYFDDDEDLQKGWMITHIPTGFSVRGVQGDLAMARLVADKILAAASWDFTDNSEAASRGPCVVDLMNIHPEIVRPSRLLAGLWLEE